MKIDVVGGSGFIGTRLCQRLSRTPGNDFRIIDKRPSKMFPRLAVTADVRSIDELRCALSEDSLLINLAAEHKDDVRPFTLYQDVNIRGAENICLVAREKNINSIVFTSSVAIYGFPSGPADETAPVNPFNEYGRTKYEAERLFIAWAREDPSRRLIIIRPTVVFGEQNRGNVYNLFRHLAAHRFVMVGDGRNRKSMAYVENVAAFIEHAFKLPIGVHVFNYVDKPDYQVNELIAHVRSILGRTARSFTLPYSIALLAGRLFDLVGVLTRRRFAISAVRVRKFCSNSVFDTGISTTGFVAPVSLTDGISRTVRYEFLEDHRDEPVYYCE